MRAFIVTILCALSFAVVAQERCEYRYWFDTAEQFAESGSSIGNRFHIEVDASALSTGFHTLNYQVLDSVRGDSPVKTSLFYKIPTANDIEAVGINCWIDGHPCQEYTVSTNGSSMLHLDLHVDTLAYGLHTFSAQVITSAGLVTEKKEAFFMKVSTGSDINDIIKVDDMPKHKELYDLWGRRVHGKPQPGIYIMNGKKIIVR